MREIKFRGMAINGEWFHGNLSVIARSRIDVSKGSYISNSMGTPFAYQVRPETVGQFTGVHDDEEGNVIFEGDIIEILHEERTINCKIKYEGGGFILASDELDDSYICMSDLVEFDRQHCWIPSAKIIGNIYENPELINS